MVLRHALSPVIDFIFPPRCPLCGVATVSDGSGHAGLCPSCWSALEMPGGDGCPLCQHPAPAGMAHGEGCEPCRANPPAHDGVTAATYYNDASRDLVLALKHGGRIALAPLLARLMATRLQGVGADWLVVPVPLHRWRLWSRGFNQSALLAAEIARHTGARLVVDALVRPRRTPSLGGLGHDERARVLSGAIALNRRQAKCLERAQVLLVDDVLTSGATTNACIAALRAGGVERVRIVCFARVVGEFLPHS
jgi:ComF family protein